MSVSRRSKDERVGLLAPQQNRDGRLSTVRGQAQVRRHLQNAVGHWILAAGDRKAREFIGCGDRLKPPTAALGGQMPRSPSKKQFRPSPACLAHAAAAIARGEKKRQIAAVQIREVRVRAAT